MTLGNRIAVMNAGKVQQLGPPLEIYDHPANVFVASFIGSPEMNMIKGVFTVQNAQSTISFGEISLSLPNNLMHGITSGDTVIAGLRPEHLTVSKDTNGFNVTVELVEKMGAQTLVVCQAGEEKIRALLDRNDTIMRGENIRLNIKPENIHLFDPESGKSNLSVVS
jgi:multiple sugar transport system ATP-binding protein